MKLIIEPAIASSGLLIFGAFTLPAVASMVGAQMTVTQGAEMSAILFLLRFVWLFFLRVMFSRLEK
jgi:hypothetical protein